ncbi:endo-1,4-beta-xylanase [Arcticibacter sp. MXS-1]|uniref:endo-1,4-beta-xylanase n=1 Tax=Arcticibacter sp. MXS-1 TaxID=3341726 RepID=UPI0035A94C99
MKRVLFIFTVNSLFFLFTACHTSKGISGPPAGLSLKEVFKEDFRIGTAMNAEQVMQKESLCEKLVTQHFNAVTPENAMKAEVVHPEWDKYDFTLADQLVDYARRRKMEVNGHTLIWHSQLPDYVKTLKDADSVRLFFTSHIQTVASRYKGKVATWDVVNEALNEDGSMRKTIFLDKLGEDYVVEAFRLAQKAAPGTKLYYNDYNIEEPAKRAGAIRLIRKIQAAGVRIDGVGIQGHWNVNDIPLKEIDDAIREFSALGLEVSFTELDISVLPNPFRSNTANVGDRAAYNAKMNPYPDALPDSVQERLADGYGKVFRIFLKHRDQISRVTLWGVTDRYSWLNNWPIQGRTNYPLLFDRQYAAKPAFYRVTDLKRTN